MSLCPDLHSGEAVGDGQYPLAPALEYEQDDDSRYMLIYDIGRGTADTPGALPSGKT
ncbi:hypothetical protein C8Q78DRAFT_1006012 [Trametes maxima]|nr:hypothetical protein C8Q78DRAFT_1006012 [Trametes maxima]